MDAFVEEALKATDVFVKEAFNALEETAVLVGDKSDGCAVVLGSGCTADAMDIVFGIARDVVVDDKRYIVHVDSAGHNIGSNKDLNLAVTEIEHHGFAVFLVKVGVHLSGIEAFVAQSVSQLFDALLFSCEYEYFVERFLLREEFDDFVGFVGLVQVDGELFNGFRRA